VFIIINLLTFYHSHLKRPDGPNIILIIADALRADHLGCYGYARDTSPNIDRFASDSLLFENAWANSSWTKPSVGSILTSLYPTEHGAIFYYDRLSSKRLTQAELLRNRSYKTVCFQTNPILFKGNSFQQGFSTYLELPPEKGKIVVDAFQDWLKSHRSSTFYAYIHFMTTHIPYEAPEKLSQVLGINENEGTLIRVLAQIGLSHDKKDKVSAIYDRGIKMLDNYFRGLLEILNELHFKEKIIIFLTADHGEELWDHGSFEHGHSLYNEFIKVHLIIYYPGLRGNITIKKNIQLKEIGPLILGSAAGNSHQLEDFLIDRGETDDSQPI